MADFRALILQRHRQLKWKAFDRLEATLMVLCGVCIFMFTLTVFLDVLTRTLGAPWLWLQQVTTAFFAWGVFVGMAAATRRNDHFYLTEITKRLTGAPRTATVTTTSPTRALVIAAPSFRTLLRNTPSMQLKVLDALASRLPPETG